MRGPEETMPVDGPKDLKVAGRKHHGTDWRALEARPGWLRMGHRRSAYRPARAWERRQDQPPNHRSIFASTSSRGRPYRSRERRMTPSLLPVAVPWMGGKVRP